MLRHMVRYYWPYPHAREILRHAELVPRWGVTGLVLFVLAVVPVWPEPREAVLDPFVLLQTLLACCGLFFSSGAVVISVASIRPGRKR